MVTFHERLVRSSQKYYMKRDQSNQMYLPHPKQGEQLPQQSVDKKVEAHGGVQVLGGCKEWVVYDPHCPTGEESKAQTPPPVGKCES